MKKFMLTDGNGNYIRYDKQSNKYVQVNNMSYAFSWATFDIAERIRRTSIGKNMRHRFYTVSIEVPDETPKPNVVQIQHKTTVEAVSTSGIDASLEAELIKLLQCANKILSKKDELSAKQSTVDKEITDLHHYMEQKTLNAYEGWLCYKRMHEILQRRRKIKDERMIINIVEDCQMNPDSITNTIARIKGLETRQYAPRVLTELFEDNAG